jgi:WD40 repeat protein
MPSKEKIPPLIPDHTLFGRVGKGAYGEVWLARNIMGAWRAIKIVSRDSFGSNRPFDREFAGIKKFEPVSHGSDSQLDVLHVGENREEGYFYYVMELADDRLNGRNIDPETYQPRTLHSDLLEHRRLPATECLQVGITLCKALEHLHAHGLIHRDIKPSNIIFLHGHPKLADIGLVANIDETISFVGTEGFVPPEGPGSVRADIYSLGKVLYELHTGFDRSQFPELPTMLEAGEDSTLARELNLVILKACAPEFARRHAHAVELREELELLLNGKSIWRLRQAEKRAVVFRRMSVVAGAIAVVVMIAYLAALRANGRADDNARRAQKELWHARLAEARAGRLSRELGRKEKGLEAIAAAAQVQSSLELRNEAIAHLALFDLLPATKTTSFNLQSEFIALDKDVSQVATLQLDGRLRIDSLSGEQKGGWKESLPGQPAGLEFTRNGKALLLHTHGHPPTIIDVDQKFRTVLKPGEVFFGFTPDERYWGAFKDKTITIRVASGTNEVSALEMNGLVRGASFHPDGGLLAVYLEKAVEVWTLRNPTLVRSFPTGEGTTVAALAGIYSAFGDNEGGIKLINTRTGHVRRWHAHEGVLSYLEFIRNEPLLVSSSFDGAIRIWSTDSGGLEAEGSKQTPVDFSPDLTRVAYRSYNTWGWGKAIQRQGYRSLDFSTVCPPIGWHLVFSPNGRWLVARSHFGLLILDTLNWEQVAWYPMEVVDVKFVGAEALLTMSRSEVQLWPIQGGLAEHFSLGKPLRLEIPSLDYLENAELSENDRYLTISAGENGLVLIDYFKNKTTVFENPFRARSPVLTRDNRQLITGTFHGTGPCVWDVETGKLLRHLDADNCNVYVSPIADILLVAGTLSYRFYEIGSWKLLKEIATDSGHDLPNLAAWSPDGKYLAIVKERNRVELRDGKSWEHYATLTSPIPLKIDGLTFNPSASVLTVSTGQGRLDVWDLDYFNKELEKSGLSWKAPSPRYYKKENEINYLLEPLRDQFSSSNWPPRNTNTPPCSIDLTPWYNCGLSEIFSDGTRHQTSFAELGTGQKTMGDTLFDIRAAICVGTKSIREHSFDPLEIRGIKISHAARKIHFLGTAICEIKPKGTLLGEISFKLANGTISRWPLQWGYELLNACSHESGSPSASSMPVVWRGDLQADSKSRCQPRLMKFTWDNPWPGEHVVSFSLRSDLERGGLMIVAVTVEN